MIPVNSEEHSDSTQAALGELVERVAVIRAAKDAKLRRWGIADLVDAELELILAYTFMPPEWVLRPLWDRKWRTVDPCALCGDPEGRIMTGCRIPGRSSGKPFGIDGLICVTCWHRLKYRKDHPEMKTQNKGRLPEMIYRA